MNTLKQRRRFIKDQKATVKKRYYFFCLFKSIWSQLLHLYNICIPRWELHLSSYSKHVLAVISDCLQSWLFSSNRTFTLINNVFIVHWMHQKILSFYWKLLFFLPDTSLIRICMTVCIVLPPHDCQIEKCPIDIGSSSMRCPESPQQKSCL